MSQTRPSTPPDRDEGARLPREPGRRRGDRSGRRLVVLTPVPAPSILGLYGFFAATLLVGSNLAGWWGTSATPVLVFPFALMLGGVAQFMAGMWAYRARDGLATAMHGVWGGFWLAFGLYQLLVTTGNLPAVTSPLDPAFGFWFIALAAITAMGALAALGSSTSSTSYPGQPARRTGR